MKNFSLKIVSFLVIMTLPFINTEFAYSDSNGNKGTGLEEVIMHDIGNDVSVLDANIEKKLNANGVLDEDIDGFSDELIDNLENCNGEFDVDVKYYICTVDDESASEADFNEYQEEELVEISEEEVSELVYSKDDNTEYAASGLFCVNAYADGLEGETDRMNVDSGILKLEIIITHGKPLSNGTRTVCTSATAYWLSSPSHRGQDVLAIQFSDGLSINSESVGCRYVYIGEDRSNPGIRTSFKREADKNNKKIMLTDENDRTLYLRVNLADNNNHEDILKHRIDLWTEARVTSSAITYASASVHYYHKKIQIDKQTYVQFGAGTDGVGINVYASGSLKTVLSPAPGYAKCGIQFK